MNAFIQTLPRATAVAAALLLCGQAQAAGYIEPALADKLKVTRPGEQLPVVVSFKQTGPVRPQQIRELQALGIRVGTSLQSLPIMGTLVTPAQLRSLAKRPDVLSVFTNAPQRLFNVESRRISGAARISENAGDFGRTLPFSGRGVAVVVNDSGVEATHPDLKLGSNVIDNVRFVQTSPITGNGIEPVINLTNQDNTDYGGGHGTHCAGTVGGNGTASGGRHRGVASGAKLIGYGSGGGALLLLNTVAGLDYALTNKTRYNVPIRVTTNSWGPLGGTPFNPMHPAVVATYHLNKAGIVSVFAAGNDGSDEGTLSPYAMAPWVIGVGAGQKDGVLTGFSSRGSRAPTAELSVDYEGNGRPVTFKPINAPTIVATGVSVLSTRAVTGALGPLSAPEDIALSTNDMTYYTYLSGTSMATPHVAGIVALMLEANPRLLPDEVKEVLELTATNMSTRQVFEVGSGHVNAYAAVALAQQLGQARTDADRKAAKARFGGTLNARATPVGTASDLAGRADAALLQSVLDRRLLAARAGGTFQPDQPLTRADLARALVTGANIRQHTSTTLPIKPTDVDSALAPFVAAVTQAGGALPDLSQRQRPVLPLAGKTLFAPERAVTRAELAYSLVQALALQAAAEAAPAPAASDAALIPANYEGYQKLAGYVQVALDRGLLGLNNGAFEPMRAVTRAEFAAAIDKTVQLYRSTEQ